MNKRINLDDFKSTKILNESKTCKMSSPPPPDIDNLSSLF